ncbi:hypothetical protein EK21DRAFT_87349 [Setomelanomma holmii]|uniref:Uncharacterized protein n=1 Tax=Setomelanomma holmii TaxID=210430 RepID=A0A9P4HER5_9PLEO|nr:hypothetical protein EK21DRAFT_87349 [Setomelanomma holmii]
MQPWDRSGAGVTTRTSLKAGAHDTQRCLRQSQQAARKAQTAIATMRQAGSDVGEGASAAGQRTAAASREGGIKAWRRWKNALCSNSCSGMLQLLETRLESKRRGELLASGYGGRRARRGLREGCSVSVAICSAHAELAAVRAASGRSWARAKTEVVVCTSGTKDGRWCGGGSQRLWLRIIVLEHAARSSKAVADSAPHRSPPASRKMPYSHDAPTKLGTSSTGPAHPL